MVILCAVPLHPPLHWMPPSLVALYHYYFHCIFSLFLPPTFFCFRPCQWALERRCWKEGWWLNWDSVTTYYKIWTIGHQRNQTWERLASGDDASSTHEWKFLKSWNQRRNEEEETKPWIKTPCCYSDYTHPYDLTGWDESYNPCFRKERINGDHSYNFPFIQMWKPRLCVLGTHI